MHRDGLCAVRGRDSRVRLRRFESVGLLDKFASWLVRNRLARMLLTLGEHRRYDGRWSGGHVTLVDFTGAGNESTQGDSRKPNCKLFFYSRIGKNAVISFTF